MHIADGVLSTPVVVTTSIAAAGIVAYSLKRIKEEEVPKISLLTAAFFVASLINIPIGPASIHPLLSGFLGLILGRRAPLAIFIGLVLQTVLFQHGGLSTLGANTLLMSIPALLICFCSKIFTKIPAFLKGFLAGFSAIAIGVLLLVALLLVSDPLYGGGLFSVVSLLVFAYLPLALLEGAITGFSVKYLATAKPELFYSCDSTSRR